MKLSNQQIYFLSCIESDCVTLENNLDKIRYFVKCFNAEFNHEYNRRAFPNLQDRIANYICGLPSCISVPFYNDDIITVGKSWGYCNTPRKESDFCNNWFRVLAFRAIQLCRKFNVEIE